MNNYRYILTPLLIIETIATSIGQIITVGPFLQDATPHSITIKWETDSNNESIVEWGPTDTLGNTTNGIAYPANIGPETIHEVELSNLNRFTTYYYRVKTNVAVSEIFNFKTPPFASDNKSFRIVAMSDMQKDNSFPNKFTEIVEDGVIDYFTDQFGPEITDNLALVLIPGDLVVNGNNFSSWNSDFFTPAKNLFSNIPVYPVLGNHENNTSYYFTYFTMPENGSPGFEERWWYKDYGNVRIIGMDSNNPFAGIDQLNWLDTILNQTCIADSIDFTFVQLHHPHKSELWTPGESDFTGEVVSRLENFSTSCGKPSIHFFGHTHGYSRGQSRDHKHLWINVATAGGAIDNWGEFPNFDYDEFSVSQDEYGFVILEIQDSNDPKIHIRRISRGDQDTTINNIIRDSLTIRKNSIIVHTPLAIFPSGDTVRPECFNLEASHFLSANNASFHGQSHWQIDSVSGNFNAPIVDIWKNFENWYFDINTQLHDDLTDQLITNLDKESTYKWRVRYRDKEMNWSTWSNPEIFFTKNSTLSDNQILNFGAEDNLHHWTITEGIVESLENNVCNGVPSHSGTRYFAVGGLCNHSPVGRLVQDIDVTSYSDSIDNGNYIVHFGGYLSNYSGSDRPEMKLEFYDINDNIIFTSDTLSTLNDEWTFLTRHETIPIATRKIRVELKGTRNAGVDNDSYFDDLFLQIGPDICCPTSIKTWVGSNSSDWADHKNWNPSCVPNINEFVVIPEALLSPIINGGTQAFARGVLIKNDGHLEIKNGGVLDIDSYSKHPLTVHLMSRLTIRHGGTLLTND